MGVVDGYKGGLLSREWKVSLERRSLVAAEGLTCIVWWGGSQSLFFMPCCPARPSHHLFSAITLRVEEGFSQLCPHGS